jgi:hypothetical protein
MQQSSSSDANSRSATQESSFPYSQESDVGSCSKTDEYTFHSLPFRLRSILIHLNFFVTAALIGYFRSRVFSNYVLLMFKLWFYHFIIAF